MMNYLGANTNVRVILTHNHADFDAIAAQLGAYKLYPDAIPVLPHQLNRNVEHFLQLYNQHDSLAFRPASDVALHAVQQIILVDTQKLPQLRGLPNDCPIHIIDHHPLRDDLPAHATTQIEAIGATTTLLVEMIKAKGLPVTALEATLLALGIYEDTGSLTYRPTTTRDVAAVGWLLERGAALETVRKFLSPPLNDEQRKLYELLLAQAETRYIHGHPVVVATAKLDTYMTEINSVAHLLQDALDPEGLFLLVEMPDVIQLVCRANGETVHAGNVAGLFGGGGHAYAGAATIKDTTLDQAIDIIWRYLEEKVHPVTCVRDLMSYGVQTIDANKRVEDVIRQMRQVGHEGFPVVEDGGQVVGLITRRIADRAIDHKLGYMRVRDVMLEGNITLKPDDSVATLERVMVESGWGQIPVIDEYGKLLGIVTRTDLINYWAKRHPSAIEHKPIISQQQCEQVLGTTVADMIVRIAEHAQTTNYSLFLVGGVVRDLLLYRRNLDIDFVVEGDAIAFAESLQERYGGTIHSYRPFGTAKWLLDEEVVHRMGLKSDDLPHHIDFATARNEFYEHPTALPTVYRGSIKLDLQRRDFTINALAVQLSPTQAMWQIIDYYNGLQDLNRRLIRVLHSLSFVDDPTRMLRAYRFAFRLGFSIEPRTGKLIDTALPMLRRITGTRLKNELTLILKEEHPGPILRALQNRQILYHIHPQLRVSADIDMQLTKARQIKPAWLTDTPPIEQLSWHIIFGNLNEDATPDICERLGFSGETARSLHQAALLVQNMDEILNPEKRPSEIVPHLERCSELALFTGWLLADDIKRELIEQFMSRWRTIRPITTGHTLKALGLPQGREYAIILQRLRAAWIDGEISSKEEEEKLLQALIQEMSS